MLSRTQPHSRNDVMPTQRGNQAYIRMVSAERNKPLIRSSSHRSIYYASQLALAAGEHA